MICTDNEDNTTFSPNNMLKLGLLSSLHDKNQDESQEK